MKLFSLSSNKDLAQKIASYLCIPITESVLKHFADGEVLFESKEPIRGEDVFIIQSTCAPANDTLMELLICIDACKRASAKSITCIMPYYGYARQDRKGSSRQSISAKLVADIITKAGATRLVCVDLHTSQIVGFFDIPVDNIPTSFIFANHIKNNLNINNLVCVSPDHGGVARTTSIATLLNTPLAIIDKRRPEPNKSEIIGIVGDIKDRDCIIVDDIVDTAGTLCNASNELKKLGARSVQAYITHGVLSRNAIDLIEDSGLDKLYITDSIPLKRDSNKIEILSLSVLLSKIILSISQNKPLVKVIEETY